jgi:hypothetical protein
LGAVHFVLFIKELAPWICRVQYPNMSSLHQPSTQAEVTYLELPGRIRSASRIRIAYLLDAGPPLCFLGGIPLAVWSAYRLLGHPSQRDSKATYGLTVTMLGVSLCLLATAAVCISSLPWLQNRWLRRVANREILSRTRRLVEPDQAESRFVAVMPRTHWACPTIFNAADVGFVTLDHSNAMVLFEGDQECYRIPVKSIVESKQEYGLHYSSTSTRGGEPRYRDHRYFFVVNTARFEHGVKELAFHILPGKGTPTQEAMGAANLALLAGVHQLANKDSIERSSPGRNHQRRGVAARSLKAIRG